MTVRMSSEVVREQRAVVDEGENRNSIINMMFYI